MIHHFKVTSHPLIQLHDSDCIEFGASGVQMTDQGHRIRLVTINIDASLILRIEPCVDHGVCKSAAWTVGSIPDQPEARVKPESARD